MPYFTFERIYIGLEGKGAIFQKGQNKTEKEQKCKKKPKKHAICKKYLEIFLLTYVKGVYTLNFALIGIIMFLYQAMEQPITPPRLSFK